jgi:cytochrome P450
VSAEPEASVSDGFPSASLLENLRFNALVIVPNAVQGIIRRRPAAVAAATKAGTDRLATRFLHVLRRSHGPGPVWVRVVRDPALLLLSVDDVRRVLAGSPDPFASDPEAKRKGMGAFQPDGLTISRGELWKNRRRFAEAVLDTGRPVHRLADRFLAVVREEVDALLDEVDGREAGERAAELEWETWHAAFRRLTRRIVLGDGARDDEELSEMLAELMSKGNGMPSEPPDELEPFMERIRAYVSAAEQGSLVGLFGKAPSDTETKVEGQVPHWLFAMKDTLAANAFRALALIATHPRQAGRVADELAETGEGGPADAAEVAVLHYLEACLHEAMRLWPTTPMLSRETLDETEWHGVAVPAGTQVLFVNAFFHRDRDSHEFADRFYPEAWTEGEAADDWSFNHFSHGPQGCPGAGLTLFVGKALLADVLTRRRVHLREPRLDPDEKLPHMLNFFDLRFALEPK